MENFVQTDILLIALGAIAFGTWLLIRGGDATVDAATAIATKLHIPTLVIGFTIVAFGTSLPELIVSINANFKDSPGIAFGNVIGSNIANILLVIGAAAALSPVLVNRKEIKLDTLKMILVSFFLLALLLSGIGIPAFVGFIMVFALLAYVGFQYWSSKKAGLTPSLDAPIAEESAEIDQHEGENQPLWRSTLTLFFGLIAVAIGADILVRGAIVASTLIGIPEAVIGLTVIAFGTSLPELATSVAAAMKKQAGIVVGNILGSNVFNILLILGVMSLLKAVPAEAIDPQLVQFDIWVMVGVAVLFGLALLLRGKLGRMAGITMLISYAAYIMTLSYIYTA